MKRTISLFCIILAAMAVADTPGDWLTHAERTSFQETGRYDEAIAFCKKLASASPWVHYSAFGQSPEGRDLPLLIISREKLFTPEAARKANRQVILIINGIHPGEIGGKDASFMMLREMVITKKLESTLNNLVLLVVPIFSVDGHERFGPYNRINQNGPKEMGWRTTSVNLNLNRDWMKADQAEMRSMLKLYTTWLPNFTIDNHVSDGADFQYDVTYIVQREPMMDSGIAKYWQEKLEPALVESLTKTGHKAAPYFEMVDDRDPAAGISHFLAYPRFTDGYATTQNRLGMTVETHMLKPYDIQVRAHYDLMISALQELDRSGEQLRSAELKADEETKALNSREVPIHFKLNREKSSETFRFRGLEYKHELSPLSGTVRIIYGKEPFELDVPWYRTIEVEHSVSAPFGYLIPRQFTDVIDRLQAHNIELSQITAPVKSNFEIYRFQNVTWPSEPFEGRHSPSYEVTKSVEERTITAGSVLVRLNQRSNRIIMGLLEPQSPDSFVAWGFFNAIFEQKEYAEPYIMETLAEEMLKKNPELKKEFEQKLKSDPKFAAAPEARLHFFYQRSPYRDLYKDAYPVVRITDESFLQRIPLR
jgi:murein tripeptide amidase MpaA